MADEIEPAPQKKGRPVYAPTPDDLAEITALAASGQSDEQIAEALDISTPTLRKHCAAALADARAALNPTLFTALPASEPAPEQPRKKGRPKFTPLPSDRSKVRVMAAAAIPHSVIAAKFNISEPTFRRAFRDDLAEAEAMARADIIDNLHRQMAAGSTSAAKALKEMIDESTLEQAKRRLGVVVDQSSAKPETPGKKAQAIKTAEKVGENGKWAQLLQ